jgi:TolB-like protein/Tfp pilus assembly protein PilF
MAEEKDRLSLSKEVSRLEAEVGPHAHHPLVHFRLFEQLKQRNVFRVAALYAVVCWLILDPVHVVFHMLDFPIWANQLVVVLMAIGFPAVLIFAWVYEVTPQGLKPTVEIPHAQSMRRITGRRLDRAIIAVLALALAYFALDKFWISKRLPTAQPVAPAAQEGTQRTNALGTVAAFNPHSIAVLPLVNESGDASQQYFSDGLSEDLITALSQFAGLKVIGRTSSFQFRDAKEDSRRIGAKLGVAHLVEGSVRRAGNVVRVSAELIDTSDGSTQWSDRYDRPYKDLFALQDEITQAVAGALKTHLLLGETAPFRSDRPPNGNLEAYNALLQGKFYVLGNTEADQRKAIEFYTMATQLDSRYALAWSLLSDAWTGLGGGYLEGASAQDAYAKARAAADTALALAPDLAEAHSARAYLLQVSDFDWRGAEAEYRRAVELAPNDGLAKFFLGQSLATVGQVEKAIELTQEAIATDPLRTNWYNWLANYLRGLNRLDEAERVVRWAITLQPAAESYHQTLTMILIQRGQAKAALDAAQRETAAIWRDVALAQAAQIGSDRKAADETLKNLIDKDANLAAYQITQVYSLRHDADKTFEWLERAWSNRDPGIIYLLYDPFILRYKDDPRFSAFCRRVGLPTPVEVVG